MSFRYNGIEVKNTDAVRLNGEYVDKGIRFKDELIYELESDDVMILKANGFANLSCTAGPDGGTIDGFGDSSNDYVTSVEPNTEFTRKSRTPSSALRNGQGTTVTFKGMKNIKIGTYTYGDSTGTFEVNSEIAEVIKFPSNTRHVTSLTALMHSDLVIPEGVITVRNFEVSTNNGRQSAFIELAYSGNWYVRNIYSLFLPKSLKSIDLLSCSHWLDYPTDPPCKNAELVNDYFWMVDGFILALKKRAAGDVDMIIPENTKVLPSRLFCGVNANNSTNYPVKHSIIFPEHGLFTTIPTEFATYSGSYHNNFSSLIIPEYITKIEQKAFGYANEIRFEHAKTSPLELEQYAFQYTSFEIAANTEKNINIYSDNDAVLSYDWSGSVGFSKNNNGVLKINLYHLDGTLIDTITKGATA